MHENPTQLKYCITKCCTGQAGERSVMGQKPMELWSARTDAVAYLEASHADQLAVLSRTFELIDLSIDAYESLARRDVYARICGLTLLRKH